jgi:hypothetical protein
MARRRKPEPQKPQKPVKLSRVAQFDRQRRDIVCRILEGESLESLARVFGTSINVIKAVLARYGQFHAGPRKRDQPRYVLWEHCRLATGLSELDVYLSCADRLLNPWGQTYGWQPRWQTDAARRAREAQERKQQQRERRQQ